MKKYLLNTFAALLILAAHQGAQAQTAITTATTSASVSTTATSPTVSKTEIYLQNFSNDETLDTISESLRRYEGEINNYTLKADGKELAWVQVSFANEANANNFVLSLSAGDGMGPVASICKEVIGEKVCSKKCSILGITFHHVIGTPVDLGGTGVIICRY